MKSISRIIHCLLVSVVSSWTISHAAEDTVLGDFEDGTYQGWTIEGDAFGDAPATGTIGKQRKVSGFEGKGLVNTFLDLDASKGTLTSPAFTVEHKFLSFLQGGGYWRGQTEIQLLVGGEVVDRKYGKNREHLEPKLFDLRTYQGENAQVRIVDNTARGWGHVLADHFVLTNTYPKGVRMPLSRELTADGRYLLVPIDNTNLELDDAPMLSVRLGDTLLYRGKGFLSDSPDKVSWWSPLDIRDAQGEVLTLEYAAELDSQALELVETGDELRTSHTLYDDPLRPQLRFSQRFGWSNDPNGMLYYDGEYHLFFQSNPLGIKWANMFWGHAVSKDLVHWEERPHALRPFADDKHHPAMSGGMCFSGGGAVDFNNTLGLQEGDTKTLFVTFTAKGGGGERLAYSTDSGTSWTVREGKLFSHPGRDPKPFWYPSLAALARRSHDGVKSARHSPSATPQAKPAGHWVIAVYNDQADRGGRNISFYTSADLATWTFRSAVPGFFECPELFELPVDEDPDNTRWVLMGADAKYLVGQFDGKTFTPEHEDKKETIVGKIFTDIYAGQCFSNTPDGRVIYIGWAGMTKTADRSSPFHNGFTVPIHLTLVSSPDGPRLNAKPIAEFDQLRAGKAFHTSEKTLNARNAVLSAKAPAQEYDIVLKLRSGNKDGIAKLRIGETVIPIDLAREDGTADIRVICDRPFMEVITGGGRRYQLINRKDRGKPLGEIALERVAGSIEVEDFTVHSMKSIWKRK